MNGSKEPGKTAVVIAAFYPLVAHSVPTTIQTNEKPPSIVTTTLLHRGEPPTADTATSVTGLPRHIQALGPNELEWAILSYQVEVEGAAAPVYRQAGYILKIHHMELSQFAQMQKRIKDWSDFISEGGVQSAALREQILSTLNQFKKVLARCWEAQKVSPQDENEIRDFERRLQQLNEEARMTVVGRKSGTPARVI